MLEMATVIILLDATLRGATPFLLAALGELVVEKSGVLNLGVEGMMLVGALAGFIAAFESTSMVWGLIAAILAGSAMALVFGLLAVILQVNQVAAGLALTIFGVGLSGFIGLSYLGKPLEPLAPIVLPYLADIPLLGVFFQQDPLVYLSWVLLLVVGWFLYKTRSGLVLRAVGESAEVAHAMGYSVVAIRMAAVVFGGALAGLGGAYLSLVFTPMWAENMTAGRGWIALGLVVFATWRLIPLALGAYLFGAITLIQLHAQGLGIPVAAQLLSMTPYVVIILVLVWISARSKNLQAPASLAQPFNWIRR